MDESKKRPVSSLEANATSKSPYFITYKKYRTDSSSSGSNSNSSSDSEAMGVSSAAFNPNFKCSGGSSATDSSPVECGSPDVEAATAVTSTGSAAAAEFKRGVWKVVRRLFRFRWRKLSYWQRLGGVVAFVFVVLWIAVHCSMFYSMQFEMPFSSSTPETLGE